MGRPWAIPLKLVRHKSNAVVCPASSFVPHGFAPFCRVNQNSGAKLTDKDIVRVNVAWNALAVALATVIPRLLIGVDFDDPDDVEMARGIHQLYIWSFRSVINQGYRWWMDRIKSMKDWALYYTCRSKSEMPSIKPGCLGAMADSFLYFPWARGHLANYIVPNCTRGPDVGPREMEGLFQFYMCGRAGPKPNHEKVIESLHSHKEVFSTPNTTGENVLSVAYTFAILWGESCREAYVGTLDTHTTSSGSATLTSSKSDHGRSNDLNMNLTPYREVMDTVILKKGEGYSYFNEIKYHCDTLQLFPLIDGVRKIPRSAQYLTAQEYREGKINDQHLARDCSLQSLLRRSMLQNYDPYGYVGTDPFSGYYTHRKDEKEFQPFKIIDRIVNAEGIEERGDKCRVITVGDWEVTTLGHFVRSPLYQLSSKDKEIPSLSHKHGGGRVRTFCKTVYYHFCDKYGPGPYSQEVADDLAALELLSLDLTVASDKESKDLAESLLTGFARGSGLDQNSTFLCLHLLEYSPLGIYYREIAEYVGDAKGGPLMGDPTTWWTVNAYTKFASWLARKLVGIGVDDWIGSKDSLDALVARLGEALEPTKDELDPSNSNPRTRCGDDELALDTPRNNIAVSKIYESLGGQVSAGTNLRSDCAGIYCEEPIHKGDCCTARDIVTSPKFVRVKNLTRPEGSRNSGEKEIPPEWTRGAAASNTMKDLEKGSEKYRICAEIVRIGNADFIERCFTVGLNPFMPPVFGGLGFPDPDEWVARKVTPDLKSLLTNLALSDTILTPLQLFKTDELQNLFSLGQVSADDERLDAQLIEGFLTTVNTKCISENDLHLYTEMDEDEFRHMTWKQPIVTNPYDGKTYLCFPFVAKKLRQRLIHNRGLRQLRPNILDAPSLSKIARKYKRILGQLRVSGEETVNFCGIWELIRSAMSRRDEQAYRCYVPHDAVDETFPDLAKFIPILE